jgi:serine protease
MKHEIKPSGKVMKQCLPGVLLMALCSLVSAQTQELSKAVARTGLQAQMGQRLNFTLTVPANAKNLLIKTSGGNGDVDLYVRKADMPFGKQVACRPYKTGNEEHCQFAEPTTNSANAAVTQTTTYHIQLIAQSAFSKVSLLADYRLVSTPTLAPLAGPTWSGFSSYYAAAIGKTGAALRTALNEAARRNHVRLSYAQVWDGIKYTDEDPVNSNNVILIYTGRSQAKSYNASGSTDQNAWNREHCWPKSHGFASESQWAHTDLHHLRAADVSVNSTRGDKEYDNGGTQIGEAPGNYTDSDSFEARNAVKGDLARMMMYMAVRYDGGDNTGVGNLELQNTTTTSGNYMGKLCTLVAWHRQDPVSTDEIRRHARIVEQQKNRNPFVDNPDWVQAIFGAACP